jgi:hypothetical protein
MNMSWTWSEFQYDGQSGRGQANARRKNGYREYRVARKVMLQIKGNAGEMRRKGCRGALPDRLVGSIAGRAG